MTGAASHPRSAIDVSVLIPVFNEREGIEACHREVTDTLANAPFSWEIVYVDDGSTDRSRDALRDLARADPKVTTVLLAYNVGQQNAMYAGLAHCRGATVVTLDSDLQCPPTCIAPMYELARQGYDLVGGIRATREDALFRNRIPSAIGRRLINRALGVDQRDFGAVKLYSRKIVDLMLAANEPIVVLPAMAYRFARRWVEIPVEHRARRTGASKWTIYNRAELFADIFTLYARRPFAPLVALGFGFMAVGAAFGLGAVAYRIFVTGAFSGLIYFFSFFLMATGLYFVTTAMLGEFLVRAVRRQRQPTIPVAEVVSAVDATGTR